MGATDPTGRVRNKTVAESINDLYKQMPAEQVLDLLERHRDPRVAA